MADHPVLEEFIRKQIEVETEHIEEIVRVARTAAPLKLVARPVL